MARQPVLVLAVFVDAFGWEIVRERGFLDDVLTVRQPLGTVFGYSSTCIPSILTGLWPRDHGHFSFFYHDPARSPFRPLVPLGLLPRSITRRGRVRHLMSRVVKAAYGYTGYFQLYNLPFEHAALFDYSEKRDLYQPGGIRSGAPTLFDACRDRGIPFSLSDWRAPEAANFARLERDLDAGQVPFAYLYLAHLDAILHDTAKGSPQAEAHLQGYEAALRRVLQIAGRRYGEVRVHLFSDHGMATIVDTCDLKARIDRLGLRFGVDYVAVYDSTMARFWFLAPGARERIHAALADEPRGRVLDDATLAAWGCDFPGQTYGHTLFLLDAGVLLVPSFMGETRLAGMHGYAPDHADSVAHYSSNVQVAEPPRDLTHMKALLLAEVDAAVAAAGRR